MPKYILLSIELVDSFVVPMLAKLATLTIDEVIHKDQIIQF